MAELKWSVRLDDKMSASAKAAAKSVDGLGASISKLKKAGAGVTGTGAKLSGFAKVIQFTGRNFGASGVNALMGSARAAANAGDTLSAAWTRVGPTVKGAAMAAGAAALAVAALGAAAIGSSLRGAMAFGESKNQTLYAFDKLLGGAAQASKAWDMVTASAKKTKTPITETGAAINALVASGFELPVADKLFRQLADLKTLNPQANLEGIARAISQIKNTGKLQGDELMQLADAGVNVNDVYTELEKTLGKTREEILSLQQAGKITASDAIAAIQASIEKKTGKDAGAMAGAAPKTAADTAKRLKEEFFNLVNLDFGPMQSFLGKLEKSLSGSGGKALAKSLSGLFAAITKGMDSMTAGDMEAIMKGLATTVDGVASAVNSAAAAWQWIGEVFDMTGGRGIALSATVAALGGALLNMATMGLPAAISGLGTVLDVIGGLSDGLTEIGIELAEAALQLGKDIISGIVAGIQEAAGAVATAVKNVAKSALAAADDVLEIGSPSKAFKRRGRWSMEGFSGGVLDGAPRAMAAVSSSAGSALTAGTRAAQNVSTSTATNSRSASIGTQNFYGVEGMGGARREMESLFRSLNLGAT